MLLVLKRRLILALIVVLLFSSMSGMVNTPSTVMAEQNEAPASLLQNGDFENVELDETSGLNRPLHWYPWGGGVEYETNTDTAFISEGTKSVKLIDSRNAAVNAIESDRFPAIPGYLYEASVSSYNVTGVSELYIRFYKEDGTVASTATIGNGQGAWKRMVKDALAPADAVAVSVMLVQHKTNVGVAYFDDAKLIASEPKVADPDPNFGFEKVDASGHLINWSLFGGQYEIVTDIVHSGNHSVKIADNSSTANMGIRSNRIPIAPNTMYQASVMNYLLDGISNVYLEFWDNHETRLQVTISQNMIRNEWTKIEAMGESPANAAYATILLYSDSVNVGTAYFDDVTFDVGDQEEVTFPLLIDDHPRLYFTASDIPAMKALAADNTAQYFGYSAKQTWDFIENTARSYLTETSMTIAYYNNYLVEYPLPSDMPAERGRPPGFENDYYPYWTMLSRNYQTRLEYLSMAYVITGEQAFADKAKEYMLSLASWDSWTEYPNFENSSLSNTHFTFGVSMAYDVLYDQLTAAERALVKDAIIQKGLVRMNRDIVNMFDHNIQALKASALVVGGSVLLGDEPTAAKYIANGTKYYDWYLNFRMNSGQQEGLLYTSYAMENMMIGVDVISRVTGMGDWINHPFLDDFIVRWASYFLAPGGGGVANFSDAGHENYLSTTMATLNNWLDHGAAGWYLDLIGGITDPYARFMNFNANPNVIPPAEWTHSVVLDEIGWAALRSGWDKNDTLLALISNDSKAGHNHYDQNSFQIATNRSWVASDAGYADFSPGPANDLTMKLGHSTILVDGQGQSVKGNGKLTTGMLAPSYDYVKGSASGAYGNKLTKFDRHVVFIKPNYYIMLDEIASNEAHQYDWVLFNGGLNQFEVDGQAGVVNQAATGNKLHFDNGKAILNATFLSEDPLNMLVTQHPGAESYGQFTKVSTGAASNNGQFLSVLMAQSKQPKNKTYFEDLIPTILSSGKEYKTVNNLGSNLIFYRAEQDKSDFISFEFEVPQTGNYDLNVDFFKSPVYGITKTYVDDAVVGTDFDAYHTEVTSVKDTAMGTIHLTAGKHRIKFENVGKNPASGNTFIGVDAFSLHPAGAPIVEEPIIKEINAQLISEQGVVGTIVTRYDQSGIEDYVLFKTGVERYEVNHIASDAAQTVVSIDDADAPAAYHMTAGTSLQYKDQLLAALSSVGQVSFDINSNQIDGVIETNETGNIQLFVPKAVAELIIDGQPLSQNEYHYSTTTNTLSFQLNPGSHSIQILFFEPSSIMTIELLLAQLQIYITTGAVQKPLSNQLNNRLEQAQHHAQKNHTKQMIKSLNDALELLNQSKHQDKLDSEARNWLQINIERVLESHIN